MATINVKDAAGSTVALEKPLAPGAALAAASRPVTLATDDVLVAAVGAKTDAKSTATDATAVSGISIWKQISASIQAAAASLAGTLTVATHAVTQSGTWTVQPGNTANTTAWKVDGSAVVQPVSSTDGAQVTIGAKTDAKNAATDVTSVSAMSVWKQISASIQAAAASLAGTLTVGTHAVTQSGTWTVQPGNTANTTAWKVDGSAVTQPVSLTSGGFTSVASFTRPANVTAYTALDVVGATAAAITFANIGPSAGNIMLTSAELQINTAAIPTGMTTFDLYLYSVTPPSALADNAAFDLPSGDRASFLGKITFPTIIDEGSTLYVRKEDLDCHIKLAGTSVFGYLKTTGGFTPGAVSEGYVVTLHAISL
jgi:hypothetical protein